MKKLLSLLAVGALLLTVTACGSSTMDTTSNNNMNDSVKTETMTDDQSTDATQIKGDWQYEGTVGDAVYDVSLDLEGNQNFTLEVDREDRDETADSELRGTYSVDGTTLTLNVSSVANNNGYFKDSIESNSTLEFDYVLSAKSLTLKNISSVINAFPDELVLYRD